MFRSFHVDMEGKFRCVLEFTKRNVAGCFSENILHGLVGYRCRSMEQFIWAVNNVEKISPEKCRKWGENFCLERVAKMYEEYFNHLYSLWNGKGFYEENLDRTELDWLTKTIDIV